MEDIGIVARAVECPDSTSEKRSCSHLATAREPVECCSRREDEGSGRARVKEPSLHSSSHSRA